MKNFIRMFQPRFAALVESGEKRQTVRKTPKRMPTAGDRISLRQWTGAPYRSKQRVLRESTIDRVARVRMDYSDINGMTWWDVEIDGRNLDSLEVLQFAKADGFADFCEMAAWFSTAHGLPFEGIVIFWSNTPVSNPDEPSHL